MAKYDIKNVPGYSDFTVDTLGNIFKNGEKVAPFKSNKYEQVCLTNPGSKRIIKGVHQVVMMTFDEAYYDGCVVHHIDGDTKNNKLENLKIMSNSEHCRIHADPTHVISYIKENGPANKGMKMNESFKRKCSDSAKKRWDRERSKQQDGSKYIFCGNQFIDGDGNKKYVDPEYYEKFRESCRKGALKRNKKK